MTEQSALELNKGDAVAALSPAARHLHLAVLDSFREVGQPPSRADLERAARRQQIDLTTAITELVDRDIVAFDQAGEIRAAYPFSPTPTRHHVTWAEGPTVYAMCAIDALGMSAMLDRPVTITTTEPDALSAITVEVDLDQAEWSPETTVVFAGTTGKACCGPSVDRACGHINFFTTASAARAWSARNPHVNGALVDQAKALKWGISVFGSLMRSAEDTRR